MSYDDYLLNNNDDDIFNDDSNQSDNEHIANTFTNHMRNEHNIDLDAKDFITDVKTDNVRAKIAISLFEATGNWLDSAKVSAFTKATHVTLDKLTDGLYSKTFYFYQVESQLSQRHTIIEVVKAMSDIDNNDFKELSKFISVEIDAMYIHVFFKTMLNILLNVNAKEQIVYAALGKELNLAVNPNLTDPPEDMHDDGYIGHEDFMQSQIRSYVTRDYVKSIISKNIPN
jgi:hypothetical protein